MPDTTLEVLSGLVRNENKVIEEFKQCYNRAREPMFKSKLQTMIADHMNHRSELRMLIEDERKGEN